MDGYASGSRVGHSVSGGTLFTGGFDMLIRFGKPVYKPVWELGRPFGLCAMSEADGKVTATVFKTANTLIVTVITF